MPKSRRPFSDDTPAASAQALDTNTALTALKFSHSAQSPEQKRFNKLLVQTQTLARKIEAAQQNVDHYRRMSASVLIPLEKERNKLIRQMALWLDERLQRRGLTARQKMIAKELICNLAGALSASGDTEMRALHDAHSPESLDEKEKLDAQDIQSFIEMMTGKKMDKSFENLDDLMRASFEHMSAQMESELDKSVRRHAPRKKTATQQKTDALEQDANGALRTIYRQLASALHPDRETDPEEQLRKTALMKDANTAYQRRDLLALLELQLKADLVDSTHIAGMAKEKLNALTTLLRERVGVLQSEFEQFRIKEQMALSLPIGCGLTAIELNRWLAKCEIDLREEITVMQEDLQEVQDDTRFKRWLRAQHQKDDAPINFLDPFDFF
jgi:hypothetical protein